MNNDNTVDLLQIKIERAKEQLPAETLNAIAAVDWRAAIMSIREKKGYNFEQLGALELETELLLCGLISSNDYPKEIQRRMDISRAETDEIMNQMNILVFKKIKEEIIKNADRKRIFEEKKTEQKAVEIEKIPLAPTKTMESKDTMVLNRAGIDVIPASPLEPRANEKPVEDRNALLNKIENPSSMGSAVVEPMRGEANTPGMSNISSMLQQKIVGSVQVPIVKTEHTLENINKDSLPVVETPEITSGYASKKDPYRLSPDE